MAEGKGTPALEEKDIITLVDEKISSDANFQTELEALPEEDKVTKLAEKKAELIKQEYSTIAIQAKKDAELANNYKIRAEKAEGENKKETPKPEDIKPNDQQLSEELKLIARGLSDEAIEKAKLIAKGKGIPLAEAVKDPDFLLIKEDLDKKEKEEKAKLGANKGSGEGAPEGEKIKGTESGATREEHKKAFNESIGKK